MGEREKSVGEGIFLSGGGNLKRSDVDQLNIFQSSKQQRDLNPQPNWPVWLNG